MKVLLEPQPGAAVTTETGVPLGLFLEVSRWNNFVEYRQGMESIIVAESNGRFTLAVPTEAGLSVTVISASPSLIGRLIGDQNA